MPESKHRMNIVTSCDNNYARFVLINLANINDILANKFDIHFYLMQSRISDENIKLIEDYSKTLNLSFHNIYIKNDSFIETIAKFGRAHDLERYYDAACHLFLPDDVDRVLYVDTGDVLFLSDDYGFYFEDFSDRTLLVSTYWNLQPDRMRFENFTKSWGGFNSGHMLINVQKMREQGLGPQDYIDYVEKWSKHYPGRKELYGGDQAFLTAFFAGDITTIDKDNPYNIKIAALNGKALDFEPKSIHFNAMFGNLKPWDIPFRSPKDLQNFKLHLPDETKPGKSTLIFSNYENECIVKWWDICKLTPIYDDMKRESFENGKFSTKLCKYIRTNLKEGSSTATQVKLPGSFADIQRFFPDWAPKVIFDVGANIGQSAIEYSRAFPGAAIHSFEPIPASFELLKKNTARLPNVSAHMVAVGRSPGTVAMIGRGTSTDNHIVHENDEKNTEIIQVTIDTGASLAEKYGVENISYLKIDTEGHDFDVLVGFSPIFSNIDFIQVEASMNPYNKTHVPFRIMEDFLRYNGFQLFKFYDQAFEFKKGGRPILRRTNPVFIRNSLVDLRGIR